MARATGIVVESNLRVDPERALKGIDWSEVFGVEGHVEIEVGIGKGRFLPAAATLRPDVLHFGIGWANKYLRIAETRATRRGLENVRFARVDAGELVSCCIPSSSVRAYYVFYPDPWPKKRHHKRRFFRKETVDHLARTLVLIGRPGLPRIIEYHNGCPDPMGRAFALYAISKVQDPVVASASR